MLLLCHRIPYPPDKGDKIRAYHLLQYLCEHYSVHLGTFIDDENDLQYRSHVEAMCDSCKFIEINPLLRRLFSVTALIGKQPLSNRFYFSYALQRWVNAVLGRSDAIPIVLYSSTVAQFVMKSSQNSEGSKIIDFVDIDSDKWRQFAQRKRWPMSWIYNREYKSLQAFEFKACEWADTSYFVSQREAEDFSSLVPDANVHRVDYYSNGVDRKYFQQSEQHANPFELEEECKPIVFTGAMDYWPNADAVDWFVKNVMRKLREIDPAYSFYIVGSKPGKAVLKLQAQPGVVVTGRVPDVRPYLQYAHAVVAPMRIARGVQNKVLEAMSMQKPVVLTEMALEGINASDKEQVLIANEVEQYIECIVGLDAERSEQLGRQARMVIERDFDWNSNLSKLHKKLLVEQESMSEEHSSDQVVSQ